jgi:hypothetical protein
MLSSRSPTVKIILHETRAQRCSHEVTTVYSILATQTQLEFIKLEMIVMALNVHILLNMITVIKRVFSEISF